MKERFINLPPGKQSAVVSAGLRIFGRNGYRKASMSDIAAAAGVSKPSLFHYFGTKKDFYLYLLRYCWDLLTGALAGDQPRSDDFFERIHAALDEKMAIIRQEPYLLSFLPTMLAETDPEVAGEIQAYRSQSGAYQNRYALDGVDLSKFKDGVDPQLVLKMLLWMSEGYSSTLVLDARSADQAVRDYLHILDVLKKNLYKEA